MLSIWCQMASSRTAILNLPCPRVNGSVAETLKQFSRPHTRHALAWEIDLSNGLQSDLVGGIPTSLKNMSSSVGTIVPDI